MIGQQFESRESSPAWAFFWGLATMVSLGIAAAAKDTGVLLFSAWPALMLTSRLLRRAPAMQVSVEETGLRITGDHEQFIEYAAIEELRLGGRIVPHTETGPRAPLEIIFPEGGVILHHRSETPLLYHFLLEKVPASGARDVPPKLSNFLNDQLANFDDDLVCSYRARSTFDAPRPRRSSSWIAVLLTAAIWIVGGSFRPKSAEWISAAIVLLISFGLLRALQSAAGGSRKARIKNPLDSGLVVSPAGLALRQGDLSGKLFWDEVRKIEIAKGGSFRISRVDALLNAIVISVDGARIVIADIYDRPLARIHELLVRTWQSGDELP